MPQNNLLIFIEWFEPASILKANASLYSGVSSIFILDLVIARIVNAIKRPFVSNAKNEQHGNVVLKKRVGFTEKLTVVENYQNV